MDQSQTTQGPLGRCITRLGKQGEWLAGSRPLVCVATLALQRHLKQIGDELVAFAMVLRQGGHGAQQVVVTHGHEDLRRIPGPRVSVVRYIKEPHLQGPHQRNGYFENLFRQLMHFQPLLEMLIHCAIGGEMHLQYRFELL